MRVCSSQTLGLQYSQTCCLHTCHFPIPASGLCTCLSIPGGLLSPQRTSAHTRFQATFSRKLPHSAWTGRWPLPRKFPLCPAISWRALLCVVGVARASTFADEDGAVTAPTSAASSEPSKGLDAQEVLLKRSLSRCLTVVSAGLRGSLTGVLPQEPSPDFDRPGGGEQPPSVNILWRKAPWETC